MTQITQEESNILRQLSPRRIIIPTLLGLGITAYLFYTSVDFDTLLPSLSKASGVWIVLALLTLFIRDGFYIYRIRHLTQKELTWTGSFYTIMLWEFSSAISPSAVGGTALASLLLTKEGIPFGKSLAYVMVSAVLDNLFFVIVGGVVLALHWSGVYLVALFPTVEGFAVQNLFLVAYFSVAAYNFLMMYGLFYKPEAIRWLFIKGTSWGWMKRFQVAAQKQGDELVIASAALKNVGLGYWMRAIGATFAVWTSRYLIVNCLLAAFVGLAFTDHLLIFSRHVLLWVILLIGFTPGAAGFAEISFQAFFGNYTEGIVAITIVALMWRIVTYYPYLIAGAIFLPRWLKRVY
jgi:uncharacterized protein (TIRG00374 family)